MTYVETTRGSYSINNNNNNNSKAYSVMPPPRTPVGVGLVRPSLDYWNKAEDRSGGGRGLRSTSAIQGITYYWTPRSTATSTTTTTTWQQQNSKTMPRLAQFPCADGAIPRARIQHSKSMPEASLRATADGPLAIQHSATTNFLKEQQQQPSRRLGETTSEKKRPTRRKLKWGRCVSSLFCCVAPPRDFDKNGNSTPTSQPSSLPSTASTALPSRATSPIIYQVTKDEPAPAPIVPVNRAAEVDRRNGNQLERMVPKDGGPPLLPPQRPSDIGKITLIIDLDETLVHSSFDPVQNPNFVIPIEIAGENNNAYVLKRPYVDEFLARVGDKFECVLFTASLSKYAGPVADLLDLRGVFRARLFREACDCNGDRYVKNLDRLGRDLNRVLIIDNSPTSFAYHPENAIEIKTWFNDPKDTELLKLIPKLEQFLQLESVYDY